MISIVYIMYTIVRVLGLTVKYQMLEKSKRTKKSSRVIWNVRDQYYNESYKNTEFLLLWETALS